MKSSLRILAPFLLFCSMFCGALQAKEPTKEDVRTVRAILADAVNNEVTAWVTLAKNAEPKLSENFLGMAGSAIFRYWVASREDTLLKTQMNPAVFNLEKHLKQSAKKHGLNKLSRIFVADITEKLASLDGTNELSDLVTELSAYWPIPGIKSKADFDLIMKQYADWLDEKLPG